MFIQGTLNCIRIFFFTEIINAIIKKDSFKNTFPEQLRTAYKALAGIPQYIQPVRK